MLTTTLKVRRSDFQRVVRDDEDPDTSYLEQEGFEDHLAAYQRGEFAHVGVWAEVKIVVNSVIQTIRSGGLWGIEDNGSKDSEAYLDEVFAEESDALVSILEGLSIEVE